MNAVVARRWGELVGIGADQELRELIACYGGAGRHYHTIDHIVALLQLTGEHAAGLSDRDAVDLAILFHDAIYEPSRRDNEEASAALARGRLPGLGVPPAQIEKIAHYIEATKHTGAGPTGDSDLDHLLDFDLSILAAEPMQYEAYAAAIRREYSIFADLLYRPGRAKVLRAFLAMPRLYRVPELAARWEGPARANLTTELARMGAGSVPPTQD